MPPHVAVLLLGEDEYRIAADTIREHGLRPLDALYVVAMKSGGDL